jgi:hypothetical protein
VREGAAEPSPAIHFRQQRCDAHGRHHRVEAIRQIFSFLRRRRFYTPLRLPAPRLAAAPPLRRRFTPIGFGGLCPIQWIGRYRFKKPDPTKGWVKDVLPVRVARSALGPDVPHVD